MRVLITGGAGYIGSILTERLLADGHAVTVLDSFIYGQTPLFHLCANPAFSCVRADARDEACMKRLLATHDAIIPLAAIVGAPACDRDPWTATAVNFDAIRMLNRLRGTGQMVVYPNTNSGYGTKGGSSYCTEESPLAPISLYGVDKCRAEEELLAHPQSITLRLATVFGASPRMRTDLMVNDFVHQAVTQGTLVIFEKNFKRNFVHVRDVAECFLFCLKNFDRLKGRPYNFGNDAINMTKEELALKVKAHVPSLFIHFSDIRSDPDKRDYIVSSERMRKAGLTAERSLDAGIAELLTAYRMLARSPYGNV